MEKLKVGDYVRQIFINSIKGTIIAIKNGKVVIEIERGKITGVPLKTLEIVKEKKDVYDSNK